MLIKAVFALLLLGIISGAEVNAKKQSHLLNQLTNAKSVLEDPSHFRHSQIPSPSKRLVPFDPLTFFPQILSKKSINSPMEPVYFLPMLLSKKRGLEKNTVFLPIIMSGKRGLKRNTVFLPIIMSGK